MTEAAPEKIIDQIAKLLALSQRVEGHDGVRNEEEAAIAAAKAQQLLFKHNLQLADVELRSRRKADEPRLFSRQLGRDQWRYVLMYAIAQTNFVDLCKFPNGKAALVGRAHNVEVVLYLYAYLSRELERLAQQGWRELRLRYSSRSPRRWKNSFYMGACAIIRRRLQAQRAQDKDAGPDSTALVRATDLELQDAMARLIGKTRESKVRTTVDRDAYRLGAVAGRDVALNRGLRDGGPGPSNERLVERREKD